MHVSIGVCPYQYLKFCLLVLLVKSYWFIYDDGDDWLFRVCMIYRLVLAVTHVRSWTVFLVQNECTSGGG